MNAKPETQTPDHIRIGVEVFRRLYPKVSIVAGKVDRHGREITDGDLFRLALDVPAELQAEARATLDKQRKRELQATARKLRKPRGWVGLVNAIKAELARAGA
jgi:hypothetical protein